MKTKIETLIQTIIDKKLGDVTIKQQSINVVFPGKFFSLTAPSALPYTDHAIVELQISGLQKHVDKIIGTVDTPVTPEPVVEPVGAVTAPVVEAIVVPEEVTEVIEPNLSAQELLEKISSKTHIKKK